MAEKRTYQQRKEYLIKAVQRRREKIRLMAVEFKGGGCQVCDYNRCIEALEFHHLDPTKRFRHITQRICAELGAGET